MTGPRGHDELKLAELGHGGQREVQLLTFEQGPLSDGTCGPLSDGGGPIGQPLRLFAVHP